MRNWYWRLCASLIAVMAWATPLEAQTCDFLEIWVDPAQGVDNPTCAPQPCFLPVPYDNPNAPTKTIQRAIDLAFEHLKAHYDPQINPGKQALIHLMPGIYGPTSIGGNGEHFPIEMRDRVHLRGVSAPLRDPWSASHASRLR